jgi:hypothetical protein
MIHGFFNMADVSSSARRAVLATAEEFATLLNRQSGTTPNLGASAAG